jgi:hypothetical protein
VREPLRRVHEAILDLLNRFTISDLAEPAAPKLTSLSTSLLTPALLPKTLPMREIRDTHEATHLS